MAGLYSKEVRLAVSLSDSRLRRFTMCLPEVARILMRISIAWADLDHIGKTNRPLVSTSSARPSFPCKQMGWQFMTGTQSHLSVNQTNHIGMSRQATWLLCCNIRRHSSEFLRACALRLPTLTGTYIKMWLWKICQNYVRETLRSI